MKITDEALVLGLSKFSESSALVSVFFKSHGIFKGLARGAYSQKSRGILISSNLVKATWSARIEDNLGTITAEPIRSIAAEIMHDPLRIKAASSAIALIDTFLMDREAHPQLFDDLLELLTHAGHETDFLETYVHFEMNLLADLGFGLDLATCAVTGVDDNLKYISPKTGRAVSGQAGEPYAAKLFALPAFMRSHGAAETKEDITTALEITGFFLSRAMLGMNDKVYLPESRNMLYNRLLS